MSPLLDIIVTRYFDATLLPVDAAAMLHYFKRINPPATLPSTVPSLMGKDVEKVNEGVKCSMEEGGTRKHVKYNDYLATERARIGQYATENGPARAVCHFSKVLDKKVPETTARRLKAEYLGAKKSREEESLEDGSVPLVTSLLELKVVTSWEGTCHISPRVHQFDKEGRRCRQHYDCDGCSKWNSGYEKPCTTCSTWWSHWNQQRMGVVLVSPDGVGEKGKFQCW